MSPAQRADVADLRRYRDEWKARAQAAEAQCAAMRQALVDVLAKKPDCGNPDAECPLHDAHKPWHDVQTALRSDAGAALLAERDRLREALRFELSGCYCDDRDGNCNPPHAPECDRCKRIRSALGDGGV